MRPDGARRTTGWTTSCAPPPPRSAQANTPRRAAGVENHAEPLAFDADAIRRRRRRVGGHALDDSPPARRLGMDAVRRFEAVDAEGLHRPAIEVEARPQELEGTSRDDGDGLV